MVVPKMATSVDAKLLKQTKFPLEFNQKVDMQKVNVEVMKKYIRNLYHYLAVSDAVIIDGSQVRYLRSLETKTMSLPSYASIFWKAHVL